MENDVLLVNVNGVSNSFGKFICKNDKKEVIRRCVPSDWPGFVSLERRTGVNVDVFLYHFEDFDVSVVMVWNMYRLDSDGYRSVDELADFIGEAIDKEVDSNSKEGVWDDEFVEEVIPGACCTQRMDGFETV